MTSPAPSMPATYGGCGPPANVPRDCEMSTKLTPAAVTRIRMSPGPGLGTGASVIKRRSCGPFSELCCRAYMVEGVLVTVGYLSSGRESLTFHPGRPGDISKGIA